VHDRPKLEASTASFSVSKATIKKEAQTILAVMASVDASVTFDGPSWTASPPGAFFEGLDCSGVGAVMYFRFPLGLDLDSLGMAAYGCAGGLHEVGFGWTATAGSVVDFDPRPEPEAVEAETVADNVHFWTLDGWVGPSGPVGKPLPWQ
jgi:hypothetical protein